MLWGEHAQGLRRFDSLVRALPPDSATVQEIAAELDREKRTGTGGLQQLVAAGKNYTGG